MSESMLNQALTAIDRNYEKTLSKLFQQLQFEFKARKCLLAGEHSLKVLQNVLYRDYAADGYIPNSICQGKGSPIALR